MSVSRNSAAFAGNVLSRLRRDPVALVAACVLALLLALSLLAPLIAPQNPFNLAELDILDAELPPFWIDGADERFFLGSDSQGRDMVSAMLYGLGLSLTIGVLATLLQLLVGVPIGLASGYAGGRLDAFFMRLADIQLSLSTLMIAIIALAIFQAAFGAEQFGQYAVPLLVLVIGFAEWPQFARPVRAQVLAEKEKTYVLAAHAIGLNSRRILIRHILPNVMAPVYVVATVQVAGAIMAEAALSFLGLGMPVSQPSLGSLIHSGFEFIFSGAWWITVMPSVLLICAILVINILGDFLRDLFNHRPDVYR